MLCSWSRCALNWTVGPLHVANNVLCFRIGWCVFWWTSCVNWMRRDCRFQNYSINPRVMHWSDSNVHFGSTKTSIFRYIHGTHIGTHHSLVHTLIEVFNVKSYTQKQPGIDNKTKDRVGRIILFFSLCTWVLMLDFCSFLFSIYSVPHLVYLNNPPHHTNDKQPKHKRVRESLFCFSCCSCIDRDRACTFCL